MYYNFQIIPAIDIKGGKCVQLRQGKKENVLFSADNPIAIAKKWVEEGAKTLHIIDLDGAFQHSTNNFGLIKRITEKKEVGKKVKLQVGGGIRSYEIATKFLNIGIDRIILGTAALKAPNLVEKLVKKFPSERIMVALDTKGGRVAIEGWTEITEFEAKDIAKKAEEMGVGSLLFTNIDVEGLMEGIRIEIIKETVASTSLPIILSGGVRSIDDIKKIKVAGASGVVIGSALYMKKINFKDAIRQIFNE